MGVIDSISGVFSKGVETIKETAQNVFKKITGKDNNAKSEVTSKTDENENVDSTQLEDDTKTGWAALSERKQALNKEMALIQEIQILSTKIARYESNKNSMTEEEYNAAVVRLKEAQAELEILKTQRELKNVEDVINKDIEAQTPKFS